MRKALKIAGVAVALAATFGLGALTGGAAAQAQGAGKSPQGCLDYIDLTDQMVGVLAEALQINTDVIDARWTPRAIERAADETDALVPRAKALRPKLDTAEQQCRGGK